MDYFKSIEGSGPSVTDPLPFFKAMRWFVSDVWRAMHDVQFKLWGPHKIDPGQCSRAVPKAKAVDA